MGGGWHYFINRPLGKFDSEKILNLSKSLYELSAQPVFIKKITEQERGLLLQVGFTPIEEYPWHAQAIEEDDTYPEQILDIEKVLAKIDGPGKRNIKNLYKYFLRKIQDKKIEFVDLDQTNKKGALNMVEKFFNYLDSKELHNLSCV